jgi:hypothetical protein
MIITQWFSLFEKTEKTVILKNKMNNVRIQLVKAVQYDNYEQRDELLKIYEILLIEFESVQASSKTNE